MESATTSDYLAQPRPYGLATNRKTAPWFVGNYIHDSSAVAWHHQKKQRHARQRAHYRAARRPAPHLEERSTRPHSESGYETIGEQQTSQHSSREVEQAKKDDGSTLSWRTATFPVSDNSTLQRLFKDLHRCDVFIARSLASLHQVSRAR